MIIASPWFEGKKRISELQKNITDLIFVLYLKKLWNAKFRLINKYKQLIVV